MEEVHHYTHSDPVESVVDITLSKMSKGYQWEIKTKGMEVEQAKETISKIDTWMHTTFDSEE